MLDRYRASVRVVTINSSVLVSLEGCSSPISHHLWLTYAYHHHTAHGLGTLLTKNVPPYLHRHFEYELC